jgi:type III secretion protein SpaR/YscT/HrcT
MDEIIRKLGITLDFEFVVVYASLLWMRLLAIVSIVPFLFGKPVPRKMRVGAAMVMMFFLYPLLKPADISVVPDDSLILLALYMKEVFVGLCIGLTASMLFYGFDAAGRMIDNQRGASLARVLIPQLGQQGSLSGQLLFQMAIVLYLVFGGHIIFLKSVFQSYELIPIFQFPHIQPGLFPMMNFLIILSGQVLAMAVQIAAPVIISILMADIILGLTNRLAPQINVWELGFNIRGFVGILSLFLAITVIAGRMDHYTRETIHNTDDVIQLLQGSIPEDMKNVKTPPELQHLFEFKPTGEEIKPPSIWDQTIKSLPLKELYQ